MRQDGPVCNAHADMGHSQPSCLAGQRYLIASRSGSYPMYAI
ncbi:MAG TPA: hypothetical protein P5307_11105 [Pirellulaceae bacterium]|nr:hypothetical protein [Pirellulaceae bacterium]